MTTAITFPSSRGMASALNDLITPQILPGENPEAFEAFKTQLIDDLNPSSAYERLMAEQLFLLELDLNKHRALRDALLLSEVREMSVGAFQKNKVGRVTLDEDEEARDLARDLVSQEPSRRAGALDQLADREITPYEIAARAHAQVLKHLEYHDTQIAELEKRRRRLRKDYDELDENFQRRFNRAYRGRRR